MKRPMCLFSVIMIIFYAYGLLAGKAPPGGQVADSPDLAWLEGKSVTLTGLVTGKEIQDTSAGRSLLLTIRPRELPSALPPSYFSFMFQSKTPFQILCYMRDDSHTPEMGSTIRIQGELSFFEQATNPGQFSQADYYGILRIGFRLYECDIIARSSDYNGIREGLYRIRQVCGTILDRHFSAENASVLRTMLLGETRQTDQAIKELYQLNGIVHVLAISGLHISLLGMGLYRLLRKVAVPIPIAAVTAAVIIVGYGLMTNMSTSSQRAVIMFVLHMCAHLLGRTYDLLTALAVAAMLILQEQPRYLLHSGFLFSFLAVLAIGLLIPAMNGPPPSRNFRFRNLLRFFLSGLCISAVTLPVYTNFYYQFPPYSLFLNLAVIPLMSVLLMTGILTILTGFFSIALGNLVAFFPALILEFYQALCLLCGRLPFHNLILGRSQPWQVILYAGIVILLILFHKRFSVLIRYLMLVCGVIILLVRIPGDLLVVFLDVGQGDGIHIQTPSGRNYFIDGGSSSRSGVGEYRIIPYLKSQGVHRLDALFISHPDQDHCNAFSELLADRDQGGISIDRLVLPAVRIESRSEEYHRLEQAALDAGITLQYIAKGQGIQERDLQLQCLHPTPGTAWGNSNEYSTVLLLRYRAFSALFTGDVEGRGEEMLSRYLKDSHMGNDITVLKVAHHGSRNSTIKLLEQIHPAYAVISAGRNNPYGHPHREVVERLIAGRIKTSITSESGAVMIWTDGSSIKLTNYNFSQ